jgi:hydrogenase nickel incorporation protein HypA/HybF
MHEFSIIENLFKIIEDIVIKERLKKIDKINLIVGEMLQIVPETLDFAFNSSKKDTKYKNTILNIEFQQITGKCIKCNNQFELHVNNYNCPECKSSDFEIISGKELIIKSIEGE